MFSMRSGGEDEEEEYGEEPLSPAARLFHSSQVNCYIIAILGCKTSIDHDIVKQGLNKTLVKHPRFSSKLVEGNGFFARQKWVRTTVNLENHIIVPNLSSAKIENPDQFVEDYISNITTTPLDLSRPLWEIHLLNLKTKDAEAVGIFRIHHSLGDGASLMSLLLSCTRKVSDPESLPTIPLLKRRPGSSSFMAGGFWGLLLAIWSVLRLFWNTLVGMIVFIATTLFLKDTKTPIKGEPGAELVTKRFVHRIVDLDHIKQVKDAMNTTVNDVLLGITQAGLAKYLSRRHANEDEIDEGTNKNRSIAKHTRLRASVLVNIRPTTGIQALADVMAKGSKARWGNWLGYILLPLNIALQKNPLDYIYLAKSTIDRKKLSLEAPCTFMSGKLILRTCGIKAAACLTYRVLSNTTMSFSNMAGPIEEISFYGHPIAYIAPSVYGHPQALTFHFQSYFDKLIIVLAVDLNTIPDPHRLCDDLEESIKLIRETVIKNGLLKNN